MAIIRAMGFEFTMKVPQSGARLSLRKAATCRGYSALMLQDAPVPLTREELDHIAALTLAHYNERAQEYWQGTRDHDVSQNIAALLRHIEGTPPFTILDVGCGPGRDLKAFTELGHRAIGLEGAPQVAAMARAHSGCEVWEQNLLALELPAKRFDGVFANAVLFHVPSDQLPGVLRALHTTLKSRGVLFSSNPRGLGQEGWQGQRYGAFHDLPTWRRHLTAAGFNELEHYYRPAGRPREEQPWLASVWRR
jgi:SAM-dependent methyltransferase